MCPKLLSLVIGLSLLTLGTSTTHSTDSDFSTRVDLPTITPHHQSNDSSHTPSPSTCQYDQDDQLDDQFNYWNLLTPTVQRRLQNRLDLLLKRSDERVFSRSLAPPLNQFELNEMNYRLGLRPMLYRNYEQATRCVRNLMSFIEHQRGVAVFFNQQLEYTQFQTDMKDILVAIENYQHPKLPGPWRVGYVFP